MKPLAKKPSPAAVAALRQATALAPKRMKASDGLLPSAAHLVSNPNSDHNTGLAFDLTHDPKNGIDAAECFIKWREDERVDYLIFNHKIWSKAKGVRKYTGSNAHEKHIHCSIKKEHGEDTSPWFWWLNEPKAINQVKAKLAIKRKKKAPFPTEVCTCCSIHRPQKVAKGGKNGAV
jgi:hypothetical protein